MLCCTLGGRLFTVKRHRGEPGHLLVTGSKTPGEPGHTRDRHKNLTNQPQNQPHSPTHAPYRYCTVTDCVIAGCVSHASVHCDSGPRAWGPGVCASCVFHSSSSVDEAQARSAMKRSRSEALAAVSTLAGSRESDDGFADGPAADACFDCPKSVAIDAEGNIVVADMLNHCIRKVTPDGTVSTLAGSRESKNGYADGPAADARFYYPGNVAIDAEGNIVVADEHNHCIRKVTPDGTVSTLAGSRESKNGFADGPAADARFCYPGSVAIDAEGNIVVADEGNHCIRKVTPDGTVSTLAGSRESDDGFADGPAADARFNYPRSVAIDAEGNIKSLVTPDIADTTTTT